MQRHNSSKLFEKAKELMPGGVSSPVRAFRAVGGAPIYPVRGKGSHFTDADGNRLLDYCMSWGPLVVGHAHPKVVEAVTETAKRGLSFGMPHDSEIRLAARLSQDLPEGWQVRFVSSGTEAVMTALRLARGKTGRDVIAKFTGCYHGHSDCLLVKAGSGLATFGTASSAGVPEGATNDVLVLGLDDSTGAVDALRKVGDRLAAVVIEGIPANNGLLVQRAEFLEDLRQVSRELGAMVIADEVLVGYRTPSVLVSRENGLDPDLITLGKVIGGGMPVGAIAGPAETMASLAPDGPVYQAGTLSGNPVAMSAGLATLEVLEAEGGQARLEQLGARLESGFVSVAAGLSLPVRLQRAGSIFWLALDTETLPRSAEAIASESMDKYQTLHQGMLERGIYLAPSGYEVGFLSTAHTEEDIDRTIEAFGECLQEAYRSSD
ncbi:MAG: glutamate-1-semialdehyde 2,1-aminomutase [Myxococcota bacterium]|nr:glutamate-1-semialdehyde 2,1-aminomutase [Myxococcota bacterium]